MRCSLLTLSSYVDHELPPEQSGELEAHLIACVRCSTALGYLREEAERIHGLAAAHASPGAAERLLIEVGLAAPVRAEDPPFAPTRIEPTFEFGPDVRSRVPRPANGSDARVVADVPLIPDEPPAATERAANGAGDPYAVPTAAGNGVREHDAAPPPAPVEAPAALFAEPLSAVLDEPAALQDDDPATDFVELSGAATVSHEPAAAAMPLPVPATAAPPLAEPAQPPAPRTAPTLLERARDAIAVRLALMRGPAADELDESVQIVSGTGAPGWGSRSGQDTHRERRERIAAASATALERPAEFEYTLEPAHDATAALPAPVEHRLFELDARPAYMPVDLTAETPAAEQPAAAHLEALPQNPPEPVVHDPPATPGRHLNALHAGTSGAKRTWAGVRALGGGGADRRAGLDHAFTDRRLWAYGGIVAVLLLVGVLVGKSMTLPGVATSPVNVPNPTAVALTPPSAAATAVPTPAHTPAPTAAPTPAGPNPEQLTGTQTLGSGGTGFQVQDLRFGAHPNDFRIVFDLSAASAATPNVQIGFGNPTTLYVEFSGTSAGGPPAQPAAGQTVTSIKLLQPSPVPGRIVYEITLSHGASLSSLYLRDPTRLVIDLS